MARNKREPLKVRFVDLTDYENLDKRAYAEAYIQSLYGVNIREWWEIVRDFGIENVREEAQRRMRERNTHSHGISEKVKKEFERALKEGKDYEYNSDSED